MIDRCKEGAREIARDRRGAIVVMALFMAVIAVGILYYMIGIGDAILMRERMQDAADASAYSGAIIFARGMNIIVLINMIMASVLAALILIKLLSVVCIAGSKALFAIAWIFPGALVPAGALVTMGGALQSAAVAAEPGVKSVLNAGDILGDGVRHIVPVVAQAKIIPFARAHFSPPVQAGVLLPLYGPLPTVDGTFERLCEKGGEYASRSITKIIKAIPGAKYVGGLIEDFLEKSIETFALYFCGFVPEPPDLTMTIEEGHPKLADPDEQQCERDGDADACRRSKERREKMVAAFDMATGECRHSDPAIESACTQRLSKARTDCAPSGGVGGLINWVWRSTTMERIYVLEGEDAKARVVLESETERAGSAKKVVFKEWRKENFLRTAPCSEPAFVGGSSTWTKWQKSVSKPVCQKKFDEPSLYELQNAPENRVTVSYKVVTDVISCIKKTEVNPAADLPPMSDQLKLFAPEEICNCAEQGQETFQIRAVIVGSSEDFLQDSRDGNEVAAVFSEKPPETGVITDIAGFFGKFAFAQAEYFFDGEQHADREEWMWHMSWKARLRPFRMTNDEPWSCEEDIDTCPARLDVCSFVGPTCSYIDGAFAH